MLIERLGRRLVVASPTAFLSAAVLVTFLSIAAVANAQARLCTRVLSSLDFAMEPLRTSGVRLLAILHARRWELGVAAVVAAIFVGALALIRRASASLVLALGAAALAALGEAAVLSNRTRLGTGTLILAFTLAVAFGAVRPLSRLQGFRDIDAGATPGRSTKPWPFWEAAIVVGLSALAILLRAWALNELPGEFDDEMVNTMNASATWYGLRDYAAGGFLGSSVGLVHLLSLRLAFWVFGPSITAVRLASLAWGTAAIPLFYALVRRVAGTGPALFATALFLTAPEQLFWSRCDNGHFPALIVITLVTAHLCLSMVQSFSRWSVMAVALCMPVCRLGYAPGYVLLALPILLWVKALIFKQGMKARRVLTGAILGGGVLLWAVAPSVLVALGPRHEFRFVNPTLIHGGTVWRHHIPPTVGGKELFRLQAARITKNLRDVGIGMVDNARQDSNWLARFHIDHEHATTITAGLAVLSLLGLGMLLGQPRSSVAGLFVFWFALGLLPAVSSDSPEVRRLGVVFPVLPICATLFVAALVRLARGEIGTGGARTLAIVLWAAGILTACSGVASHLLLPLNLPRRAREACFTRPLLERADTVFHNFFMQQEQSLALTGMDRILDRNVPLCLQYVKPPDWIATAFDPACDFTDVTYATIMGAEERRSRGLTHVPRRLGFLLELNNSGRPKAALLSALYPRSTVRQRALGGVGPVLWSLEVGASEVKRLFAPELRAGSDVDASAIARQLLPGVSLVPGPTDSKLEAGTAVVRAGLLVRSEGWRSFALEPACRDAVLKIGGMRTLPGDTQPMLPGVYPLEVRVPRPCAGPFRVLVTVHDPTGRAKPVDAGPFLSPHVARIREAQPPPMVSGLGWGSAETVESLPTGVLVDLGTDGGGGLHLLSLVDGAWQLRSTWPGQPARVSHPKVLLDLSAGSLGVGSDGTCLVVAGREVEVYQQGSLVASWSVRSLASDVAVQGERAYFALPWERHVAAYNLDGTEVENFDTPFRERLSDPAGVAISSRGDLAIIQSTGPVLIVGNLSTEPRVVASFDPRYDDVPTGPDLFGAAFDGPDRLLLPHHSRATPLEFDLTGNRVLPDRPEDDLSAKGFVFAARFGSTPDALYVLDPVARVIRRVARRPGTAPRRLRKLDAPQVPTAMLPDPARPAEPVAPRTWQPHRRLRGAGNGASSSMAIRALSFLDRGH